MFRKGDNFLTMKELCCRTYLSILLGSWDIIPISESGSGLNIIIELSSITQKLSIEIKIEP